VICHMAGEPSHDDAVSRLGNPSVTTTAQELLALKIWIPILKSLVNYQDLRYLFRSNVVRSIDYLFAPQNSEIDLMISLFIVHPQV